MPPIVVWIVLGLVSGIAAKLILPGKDKGGLITTTLVGIAGSVLGGFVGRKLGLATAEGGLSALDFATAIGGALVLLLLFRLLRVVF
jgi:uncharacterized membrane protein YeaQ/YmgE (transglycosylase-associated protein family)